MALHIGLVINPLAGLGGKRGLKGSDGDELRNLARQMSEQELHRSQDRVLRALGLLRGAPQLHFSTWGGAMGGDVCKELGLDHAVLGESVHGMSSAADTRAAVQSLKDAGVDLLVFGGGDGTARDIFDVVGDSLPVLGIPAGVKMHSGVFSVSPEAAGELLLALSKSELVGLRKQEVRDIDEEAFRHDVVRSRFYGDMLVPGDGRF